MRGALLALALLAASAAGCRRADDGVSAPVTEAPAVSESLPMGGAKSVTTVFIASRGPGNGADAGGPAAADAHCRMLAAAEGSGDHTWRAYVSASARDRIGNGPWYNAAGDLVAANVEALHDDNGRIIISSERALTEKAEPVSGSADELLYCFAID